MPSSPNLAHELHLASQHARNTGILLKQRMPVSFSKKMHELRIARGWTQEELAKQLDMGIAQVKRYEHNQSQPTLTALKKIATTFRVSIDEIAFEHGSQAIAGQRLDSRLLELFEEVSQLPERQRDAVKFILDSVVANSKMMQLTERQKGKA